MNIRTMAVAALVAGVMVFGAAPVRAATVHTPDQTFELMSVKFWRGITNVATCPVELPKQLYTVTRDRGIPGPAVGLLKGVWMTGYRAVCGVLETALFLVPAPGDYESLAEPAYVWQGWAKAPPAVRAE